MNNEEDDDYQLSEEDIEVLKAQTQEWAKREGAKLVHSEADGNLEVWEFGKAYSRKRVTKLYGEACGRLFTGWKYKTYEQIATDSKKFAIDRLMADFDIHHDLHLPISESGCSTLHHYLKSDAMNYKEDDLPTLLARMIELADYSLDKERFSEEFRMTQALRLGNTIALYNFYLRSITRNSVNAKSPKDPIAHKIYNALSKRSLPAKDLWEVFKQKLRDEHAEVEVKESNPKQTSTWEISYRYFDDRNQEISQKVKFSSFKSRISKSKKS